MRCYHLFAILLAVACQGDEHPAEGTDGATAIGSISISAQPILTIAPTDSDGVPLLAYTVDATRLSTGAVAVVDRGVHAVMLFDSTGRLVTQAGREGAGPGEFGHIGGVGRCAGDTLFVWDGGNDRMTVLSPTGEYLRAYRLPGELVTGSGYCAGSNQYLVWTQFGIQSAPSPDAPPLRGTAVLVSANGDSLGTLGDIQAGENRPMGKMTVFAVVPAGIYVGTGDSAAVTLYGRDGSAVRSLPVGIARRPATAEEYDAAVASLAKMVPGGSAEDRASMLDFMHKRFPKPDYLPPYRAILTNGEGALFVITSPLGAGVTEIEVFDAAGRPAGQLRIPGDIEVYEIGADYLLGMVEDGEGEQRVVMYKIERR